MQGNVPFHHPSASPWGDPFTIMNEGLQKNLADADVGVLRTPLGACDDAHHLDRQPIVSDWDSDRSVPAPSAQRVSWRLQWAVERSHVLCLR
jgi:hypothetical protein